MLVVIAFEETIGQPLEKQVRGVVVAATAMVKGVAVLLLRVGPFVTIYARREGSHRGLVRAPAKRLARLNGLMGSNPIPSATKSVTLRLHCDMALKTICRRLLVDDY